MKNCHIIVIMVCTVKQNFIIYNKTIISVATGGWQWVDGSPLTFVNWADPASSNSGKDCAELRFDSGGKWYHISCKAKSHYICEKPKSMSK